MPCHSVRAQVPWHFEIEPIAPRTDDKVLLRSLGFTGALRRTTAANAPPHALRRLYCSILDYRAPEVRRPAQRSRPPVRGQHIREA